MSNHFEFSGIWKVAGALHVGTGLGDGRADRTIRLQERTDARGVPIQIPVIPGEAVKGAVRSSAERLVRWLAASHVKDESKDHSRPGHPALTRLFRGDAVKNGPTVRFYAAEYVSGGGLTRRSSTKIALKSGAAEEHTLRIMDEWSEGARFRLRIQGWGADWIVPQTPAWWDLGLMIAAALSVDGLGGKKGSGLGSVRLIEPALKHGTLPLLGTPEWTAGLKAHLENDHV
jgi:CRISPR/Cas system CSM-associated protein Csm3 (group 7 of RAMP superfamily)